MRRDAMVTGRIIRKSPMLRYIQLLLTTIPVMTKIEATCNNEQVNICHAAATEGRLHLLRSGGQCIAKQYMEFTHLCSVTNYLPNVDFCCCTFNNDVLCCRYHQEWNRFRCEGAGDVVAVLPNTDRAYLDNGLLKIVLPCVLGPLSLILCCTFICLVLKRKCYTTTAKSIARRQTRANDDTTEPLAHHMLHRSTSSQLRPSYTTQQRLSTVDEIHATAPPMNDDIFNDEVFSDSAFASTCNGHPPSSTYASLSQTSTDSAIADRAWIGLDRSLSYIPYARISEGGCSEFSTACPNCSTVPPPPTYDESRTHPLAT